MRIYVVRVREGTHSELMRLKGLMGANERRNVSIDEVIQEALKRVQTSMDHLEDKIPFPTPEWLDEYVKRLNESKELAESGKGWGVGWNGDFVFQIDDLPLEKIKKLPEGSLKNRMKETKKYVTGKTVYTYIQLKDGKCLGARVIKDLNGVQAGFRLAGPYRSWKKLARAELDAARAVTQGELKLDGDVDKVMRYMRAAQAMGRVASEIPTEFLDELVP